MNVQSPMSSPPAFDFRLHIAALTNCLTGYRVKIGLQQLCGSLHSTTFHDTSRALAKSTEMKIERWGGPYGVCVCVMFIRCVAGRAFDGLGVLPTEQPNNVAALCAVGAHARQAERHPIILVLRKDATVGVLRCVRLQPHLHLALHDSARLTCIVAARGDSQRRLTWSRGVRVKAEALAKRVVVVHVRLYGSWAVRPLGNRVRARRLAEGHISSRCCVRKAAAGESPVAEELHHVGRRDTVKSKRLVHVAVPVVITWHSDDRAVGAANLAGVVAPDE
jgi:hypothetical protein